MPEGRETMSYEILSFDPEERVREKRASRERDARLILSGQASEADIAASNDFFAALDLGNFRIRCIGRRPPDLNR